MQVQSRLQQFLYSVNSLPWQLLPPSVLAGLLLHLLAYFAQIPQLSTVMATTESEWTVGWLVGVLSTAIARRWCHTGPLLCLVDLVNFIP